MPSESGRFSFTFVGEAQLDLVFRYFFFHYELLVYTSDFYVSILRILFPRTITREDNFPRVMYIRFIVADGAMKFEAKSTILETTSWAIFQ